MSEKLAKLDNNELFQQLFFSQLEHVNSLDLMIQVLRLSYLTRIVNYVLGPDLGSNEQANLEMTKSVALGISRETSLPALDQSD